MDHDTVLLRRYVIRRSSGTYPCPEYARRVEVDGIGVWLHCGERAAHKSDRWKRVRVPGRPWCPVLGTHLDIARDVMLQAYFATIHGGGWFRAEQEVRRHPRRCLSEWRAAGHRLIDAAKAAAAGHRVPGRLSGWPVTRGTGVRSLIPGC